MNAISRFCIVYTIGLIGGDDKYSFKAELSAANCSYHYSS